MSQSQKSRMPWKYPSMVFRFSAMAYLSHCGLALEAHAGEPIAWFQAHRGAIDERPENTLAALKHAWSIAGAVPEVDLRTTSDGVIVCIHDETPARTTDAPKTWGMRNIAEISFDTLHMWDAGAWFDPAYGGERVPALDEVFDLMVQEENRQLYLDLKAVELDTVVAAIKARGFERRIFFVHGDPVYCATLQQAYEGARTMTWLSGPPTLIEQRFHRLAAKGFHGLNQIQLHLQVTRESPISYVLGDTFLANAVATTRAAGVDLQVRPFAFDGPSLRRLLDMGIRWYVADAPGAFHEALEAAEALAVKPGTQEAAKTP
jgi:glycerophosphoryl diester phosphodiesterase